jgi:hypothetical protein
MIEENQIDSEKVQNNELDQYLKEFCLKNKDCNDIIQWWDVN